MKVQGTDSSFVENVANQLGLEGSYVPHTYIEQMQLERRVNDVMGLPDALKTQLSLDDDTVCSPPEALSRAYADCRMKYLHGRLDVRAPASPAILPNQGVTTQVLDQISTLKGQMDDFTSHIEELSSKILNRIAASGGQHTLALPMENDNRSLLSLSSSSSQLGRESPTTEEVALLAREQRQIMLQIGTLSNLIQEYVGETSHMERVDSDRTNSTTQNLATYTVPVLLALAIGWIGILAFSLK